MDRNTVIGLVIIALILVGYSYFMQPSEEELQAMKARQDSIAMVEARRAAEAKRLEAAQAAEEEAGAKQLASVFRQDSVESQVYTLENEKLRVRVDGRGGRVSYVELKEYCTHDSLPLVLWSEERSEFYLSFYAQNKAVNTGDLMFTGQVTEETERAR